MIKRPSFINELDFNLLCKKYPDEKKLEKVIEKIKNDYPVQYLIGDVEFLNTTIEVNKSVLIPRFETELFVNTIAEVIMKEELETARVVDMCTGSGCIAIALKKDLPTLDITGVDIKRNALKTAKSNAELNKTDIKFIKKDVLKNHNYKSKFSVLISNPPYVEKDEFVTPNTKYEPRIALYPKGDSLIFYKKILDYSKEILEKKNIIAFEINDKKAEEIRKYARKVYPNSLIQIKKDYNKLDRFIFIFNK